MADVSIALKFAKEKNLKILILGSGSIVSAADKGFDVLVMKIDIDSCRLLLSTKLTSGAGTTV